MTNEPARAWWRLWRGRAARRPDAVPTDHEVGGQYADVIVDDEQDAAADSGDGAGDWPVAARLLRATDDAKHAWQDVTRIDPNVTS
jgi:hypothetical protein